MKPMLALLALAAIAAGTWWWTTSARAAEAERIPESSLFAARRGDLLVAIVENGYLKAKNNETIKPRFDGSGTITWLIEEGTAVAEGDVLAEFDKTELENEVIELENQIIQYEAELEAAQADLEIQERDSTASIASTELGVELKQLALERYERGEAPNELRKKRLEAEKARSAFERASELFEQVPELEAEGFLTKVDVEEERIRLREAEINMENTARDLELFETYTHEMDLKQKQADLADARRELENARVKATINLKEKQARVKQKERQLDSSRTALADVRQDIEYMTIRAPTAGVVHYGDPDRPWWSERVQVGGSFRNGNTIFTLPDLSEMQVLVQIHEADIDQIDEHMPVTVTIESQRGRSFPAAVTEIASVASSQSWSDDTNKTFKVEITMEPTDVELRAGVTAKAEILVEQLTDVLHVPIHAVVPEGEERFCFVQTGAGVERRTVEVGRNNAHYVEILAGLEEGEKVLLYDPREEGLDAGGGSSGARSGDGESGGSDAGEGRGVSAELPSMGSA